MIDATDAAAQPLKKELHRFGAREPACRALIAAQYGIGELIAVAVWFELGDCRRFSRSEQAQVPTERHIATDNGALRPDRAQYWVRGRTEWRRCPPRPGA
ncbi:MAG: hypothetical protein ACRDGH_01480 [Candidatus Limnocylindria bacterium]